MSLQQIMSQTGRLQPTTSITAYDFHTFYAPLVQNLLENKFRDIKKDKIVVRIEVLDDPKRLDGIVTKKVSGIYLVMGAIPSELLGSENLESVLRGLLGHELSHIALGDLDMPKGNFYMMCTSLPILGEKILEMIEKRTDRETVKRGLGKELYQERVYFENFFEQHNLPPQRYYYTSTQLKWLIERKNT